MLKKIITIILIFQIIFIPISNAADTDWDKTIKEGKDFIFRGGMDWTGNKGKIDQTVFDETVNTLYNVLLALGVVLAVIFGAILGIKHMVGSIEEQAKTKEMLLPYVAGCIVTFGAFGIWRLIINVLGKI